MSDTSQLERQYWSDVIAGRSPSAAAEREERSAATRRVLPEHCDLAYGEHLRQKLDLFLPPGTGPWPLLAFIHGGYWRRGSKDEWAFLADGWNSRGLAVATIGYRLLPEVRLPDIVADVSDALRYLADNANELSIDVQRLGVSGISAGGHLAAMVSASGVPRRIRPVAAILLSGVYDPRPLRETSLQEVVDASLSCDWSSISPLGLPPPKGCRCIVAWGADETDVFENQSRTLARHWANWGVHTPEYAIADKNHFSIVDCLHGDADSPVSSFIAQHLLHE